MKPLTKHRQAILEILNKAHTPLSATAVSSFLPKVNLTTIYRNLDYFVSKKMVKRIILSPEECLYEVQQTPHHHAKCDDCDRVIHFTLDEDLLKKALHLENFDINDIELLIHGTCHNEPATLHHQQ